MHFSWTVALPNLLIGLREGLEAGLVVSILVAAVRRLAPGRSLAGVWTGVAGAVALSLSFGAVLTFTETSMSSKAQEIFAGSLSLLAVVLVTFMVFWMRRTARSMSGELKAKVGSALAMGGTALVITAFVAVAREGLETALFIWTNTRAAGSDLAPLTGAAIGLVIAVVLCAGMYRRVLKINLTRFFTITGAVLVVIAAGVLAYGLRDLGDAGLVTSPTAYDFSGSIPADAWWVQIMQGTLNLTPSMTWLQVIAYLGYGGTVMTLFVRGARQPKAAPTPAPTPDTEPKPEAAAGVRDTATGRRRLVLAGAVVAVPLLVAGALVWAGQGKSGPGGQKIALSRNGCTGRWTAPKAGRATFSISNQATKAVDIELISTTTSAIAAEIEVLGPGTTRDLPVTLTADRYAWRCVFDGSAAQVSAAAAVTGRGEAGHIRIPVTAAEMKAPLDSYAVFVGKQLGLLKSQVATLHRDTSAGHLAQARKDWLTAHLTWRRMGAAYDAFGAAGKAVDGLAQGLPDGVRDKGFAGFHKVEYDLWHGGSASAIDSEVGDLATAVDKLDTQKFAFDPKEVATRAHEILEDTARFQLTGQDDYGSGTSIASAQADVDGERTLLGLLAPLINPRSPGLVATANADLDAVDTAIAGTEHDGQWVAVKDLPLARRQPLNAAVGQAVETLAPVPDLLEIQKA
ncbi:MAG: iron permease [Actinoallomurus sp.]|nr:iron permease [Actinoallomurus sp.]